MKPFAVILMVLAAAGLAPAPAAAEPAAGRAAFLFGYVPKPGERAHFAAGYRRHLQWHRRHGDPLAWYGWFVTGGDRLGMFIDGSFGVPFAAFDKRVDPAGDRADAIKNFAASAKPAFRSAYVVRPDLSTGRPLKARRPSKSMQVFYYTLRPGAAARFESVVRAARETLLRMPDAPAHTWYKRVEGGRQPVYLLMVARDGWASYAGFRQTLAQLASRADASGSGRPERLDRLHASVGAVRSEIWTYRADLSYFPKD